MVFLAFGISAAITVFLAIRLSIYADAIERKSALSGVLIALLLGGATSLPEITTSVTSIIISNPDLAVGNVLGSNLFNVMILATLDLFFRKHEIMTYASKENRYTSLLTIFLSFLVAASLFFNIPYHIFGVGIDTVILIIVYFIGVKIISTYAAEHSEGEKQEENLQDRGPTLKRAVVGFSVAAVFIMVFGSILTISGDRIAVITGLGASFVGSFLVAASTSLPEAVSVAIGIRLKNYKLAIGGIVGSNLFNLLILAGTDVFYRKGALLSAASSSHLYTIVASMILISISLFSMSRKNITSSWFYVIPSILIIACYFIASYIIYLNSAT
ncbi:cation transporter [Priestia aryabhattai]|uniref:sodium:calcium antiporter n=1 Tax=Priestia TaxID=2800373 RepID=UPI000BA01AE5|nr:cation transporter [Priestia aryabhattai]